MFLADPSIFLFLLGNRNSIPAWSQSWQTCPPPPEHLRRKSSYWPALQPTSLRLQPSQAPHQWHRLLLSQGGCCYGLPSPWVCFHRPVHWEKWYLCLWGLTISNPLREAESDSVNPTHCWGQPVPGVGWSESPWTVLRVRGNKDCKNCSSLHPWVSHWEAIHGCHHSWARELQQLSLKSHSEVTFGFTDGRIRFLGLPLTGSCWWSNFSPFLCFCGFHPV